MKKTKFTKVAAVILCVVMVVSMLPTTAFAASTAFTNAQLSVVTDKESTLAPGVTQNNLTVYDKNGHQVKMFITTADMSVDSVKLFTAYKNMDPTDYGMSKLTEQVASFDQKVAAGDEYYQGTVVAGINASYYNTITGKPTGTFVMNGIDVTNEAEGNSYGYFAVMNDGSVKIGNKGDYSKDKGNIREAIGIYHMLIVDGKICSGLDPNTKYPRQTIGITADGKVILMTADGNQAPTSAGLTILEQAQAMLDLGCVWAGHLDGGGSATYGSKPEGQDEFVITNRPSDGSERSVSNSFLIVSTAAASYSFDHVIYEKECEYVTPGTSIEVSFDGVSSTGHAAEIPEGLTFETVNGTFENGVFTAGSKAEEATITAMYNGKPAGQTTINVVVPETIKFNNSVITIPYGKTVTLGMTATYGVNTVKMNDDDVQFIFDNNKVGTVKGFVFTAGNPAEDESSSKVTAKLKLDSSITAEAEIVLGKGSEVVYDFEDGTNQKVYINETPGTKYNYTWPESEQFVATADNGKVHSGSYALGSHINYANSLESGYMKTSIYSTEQKIFKNAVGVGVWMYIPDEWVGLWARWTLATISGFNEDGSPIWGKDALSSNAMDTGAGGTGVVSTFDEPGWHYLYADTSAYPAVGWKANQAMIQLYISDRDGSAYNYYAKDHSNIPAKYTVYIDDVIVDYSSAVDDREAPVLSNVTYAVEGMADAAALNGNTITTNKVTLAASVDDYKGKTNFTGLDESTVKAYVDGVEVAATYTGGKVSVNDIVLNNGKHTVKFSACDKMGNYGYIYRTIVVNAENSGSTIKLVPTDANLKYPKLGSIYNMDIVATAIEEVQSVEIVINLDNNSTWQLDHMVVAKGFEATYTVDADDNVATITITRTGENTQTGEVALATLPVRVWTLKTGYTYANGTKAGAQAFTLAQFKSMKEFWRMSVIAEVDKGVLTRVDNTVDTFTGERVFCDTEMWGNYGNMTGTEEGKAYYNSWNGGHLHTAKPVEDKAATCTEDGYTGRTFCEVCNSVVDWGTTIPATGHTFTIIEGLLKCSCGKLFSGVYTDGKTYMDGAVVGGWVGDSYYSNGVMFTGVQLVDGYYYDFGENGVCAGKAKYTGLFYDETVSAYRFSKLGELTGGWHQIEEKWHFFKYYYKVAVTGEYTVNGITYLFDEKGMTEGTWHTTEDGKRQYYYGPSCHKASDYNFIKFVEIDGKTYNFDRDGFITIGIHVLKEGEFIKEKKVYEFDENGVFVGQITRQGIIACADGANYYINEDGYIPMDAGLVKYGADYCYVIYSGKLVTGAFPISEAKANGLLPAGTYLFGADGKMILEPTIYNDCYYNNGKLEGGAGLVKVGEDYYYVSKEGQIFKNQKRTINEEMASRYGLKAGTYEFDAEGKMVIKNGIVEDYYYVNGALIGFNGVVEVEGSYYFITVSGKVIKDQARYVENFADGLEMPAGTYLFGADGKMILEPTIYNDCYYNNGKLEGGAGLVKVGEDYYYVSKSGQIFKDQKRPITAEMAEKYGFAAGTYSFDAEGKMVIFTGISEDGYYYKNGAIVGFNGMVEVEGDYYFITYSGKVLKDQVRYVENFADGLEMTAGNYLFGADGKMILEPTIYNDGYYNNGKLEGGAGLVKVGEDYYYVSKSGQIFKDQKRPITAEMAEKYGFAAGTYSFDAEGKMVIFTGISEDGYYYKNGAIVGFNGMVEVEGDYYFITYSGKVLKDQVRYVENFADGLEMTAGNYLFGADGKMILEPTIYNDCYYNNGKLEGGAGLVKVGEDYYYVSKSGQIFKDQKRPITAEMAEKYGFAAGTYSFDAEGKMVIFTGISEDGYYYKNGAIVGFNGMVEVEGDYYFITYSGKVLKDQVRYVENFAEGIDMTAGNYIFGADGKMILEPTIYNDCYYNNGKLEGGAGLVKVGEDYYYVSKSGQIFKDQKRPITAEMAEKYGFAAGTYSFDAEGKMVI